MKSDVIKETLNLLRIYFTISIASVFATVAWLIQNCDSIILNKVLVIFVFVFILICIIVFLEIKIRSTIKLLMK